jgi:hypothetical protein
MLGIAEQYYAGKALLWRCLATTGQLMMQSVKGLLIVGDTLKMATSMEYSL